MTDAEIIAAVAIFLGGACNAATGFGFALVAAPLMVAALPPEQAIAAGLALGILVNTLTLLTERRRAEPLWREAGKILAWGAAGAVAGAFLLTELDRTAVQLLVTASVLGALATRRLTTRSFLKGPDPFRKVEGGRGLPLAGLAAGALTTTTSANGPPLLLYFLGRGISPARMRDTLSVLFISFGCIGLAALAVGSADLAIPGGALVTVFPAAAAAGHVAGRPVFARLAEGHYEQVVAGLLLVSVLAGGALALT